MPTKLTKLRVTRVDCVDKGANQAAHILLWKRKEPPMAETIAKADHDAVVAKLKEAETQIATLTEQVRKLTPVDPEDIWKGVSPVLKAKFVEQEKRAKAAEEAIAVEKAEREKVVYIGKARGFKYLPINPDDDWEVFQGVASLPAPVQERVDALLKAGEEFGRLAGLDKARGRSNLPAGDGSPLAELESIARSHVVKGLAKDEHEGMQRAIRDNPELYRRYSRSVQQEEKE